MSTDQAQADARDEPLPPEPDRPDCCNGGCAVCVLDGFEDEVEAWRRQCETILARRAERQFASAQAMSPAATTATQSDPTL